MELNIVLLPGDGIGPEVVNAAVAVLNAAGRQFGHQLQLETGLIGGCAIDRWGTPLPEGTLGACLTADAVLLGAVGGPKWDDPTATVRPEQGLLGIRKALGLFANLRPVVPHPDLVHASPLRPERLAGTDLLVVRELTGGVYFGTPRTREVVNGERRSLDTMVYTESEIGRVARVAFDAARARQKKLTSIDKANVLESSRLWRQVVTEVGAEYPDVTLEHMLVDAATMHLISRPATFDVIVAGNLFGDILTDEASMLTGSMGNLPSASLGDSRNRYDLPRGMYEPIHGSAPDIAGKGIANPIGMILSVALMLRHSFGLETEAAAIEAGVDRALAQGARTGDLVHGKEPAVDTAAMTAAVVAGLPR